MDVVAMSEGRERWRCPNCGGDCFDSWRNDDSLTYTCHGNSLGTETEQTPGCGYWVSEDGKRSGVSP